MTQALYNKWRPRKWEEVVGQQHVVQTLRNAVSSQRVAHAYLFAGPRGTGKTTVARLLAKAVNCLNEDPAARPCNACDYCTAVNENRFLDLIEIDAASTNSVDDVRDLRDKINFIPNQGKYKIYIIDEVHMLSTQAFNALLKTLEEPPEHAIFILATTEIHKIPATILSRCQRHEFRRVPVDDIVGQLTQITKSEKLKAEPQALTYIARQSAGGMRDAISLLDQMASTGKEITLALTQSVLGTATSQTVTDLVDSVLEKKPAAGMEILHKALDAGNDPRQLARQVVDYLRSLLLLQMGNGDQVDLPSNIRKQAEKQAATLGAQEVVRMIKVLNEAATDLRGGWQPSLPLELALAELMEQTEATKIEKKPSPSHERTFLAQANHVIKETTPERIKKTASPVVEEAKVQKEISEKASEMSQPGTRFEDFEKSWNLIYSEINQFDKLFAGLINTAWPLEYKKNIFKIGIRGKVNRDNFMKPEKVEELRKVIQKLFGVEPEIDCVVMDNKGSAPPEVKKNGMVAAALNKGGEIVDIQD